MGERGITGVVQLHNCIQAQEAPFNAQSCRQAASNMRSITSSLTRKKGNLNQL
jgi:hypothetical protein